MLGWDQSINSKIDVRLFYAYRASDDSDEPIRGPDAWTVCRWAPTDESVPEFYRLSNVSENWSICYSTEALKYAQSAYLVSIVVA